MRRETSSTGKTNSRKDALGQSFFVYDTPGCFITSVDFYFLTKSKKLPVELQIRTMENGVPTDIVLASTTLEPNNIEISIDGTLPSTFTFDSPVYLQQGEYVYILIADTDEYNIWISRVGDVEVSTAMSADTANIIIDKQPTLGTLFKSQNASTYTPTQTDDIKFTARKAQFSPGPASFRLYNAQLNTFADRNQLIPNPIEVFSRKANIGLTSAITDYTDKYIIGGKVLQNNTTASGFIESLNGALSGDHQGLNITNAGIGYSNGTFESVNFTTLTGDGFGATGIVTVSGGTIDSIAVVGTGTAYSVGDTVSATLGDNTLGRDLLLTVGLVTSVNSFSLTNISGEDFDLTNPIQYFDSSLGYGVTTSHLIPKSYNVNTDQNDGLHFRVLHNNHGMHQSNNTVEINGATGDKVSTKITVGFAASSFENISVGSSINFNFFEGSQVTTTNPGLALIGEEIISYTGVGENTLTGINTRGVDFSIPRNYDADTPISKYEIAGVSLRKINTTHNFANVTNNISDKITLDQYFLKITGNKYFTEDEIVGGSEVKASQNIMFESITPNVQTTNFEETFIETKVRTTSASSINGNEPSFVDKGFELISLNNDTLFETPRMIASKVNEDSKLAELPGAKSFTLEFTLETDNGNVSPVVDVFNSNLTATTRRINAPVSDYRTDSRPNLLEEDPHNFNYLTKLINLESPATSLKVIMGIFKPPSADVRVLYRLKRVDGSQTNKIFSLMPGFNNLDVNDNIIDPKNNDGSSDTEKPSSIGANFIDHTFTADNLPQFSAFQIKVELTSTNQATVPLIKDFRTIALA